MARHKVSPFKFLDHGGGESLIPGGNRDRQVRGRRDNLTHEKVHAETSISSRPTMAGGCLRCESSFDE